jgi:hypothetical protein
MRSFLECQADDDISYYLCELDEGATYSIVASALFLVASFLTCVTPKTIPLEMIIEDMDKARACSTFDDESDDRLDHPLLKDLDSLLTAEGGLKGASEPVYYRVLMDENGAYSVYGHPAATALSKRTLERPTYHMAFQGDSNLAWHISAILGIATYIHSSTLPAFRWYGHKSISEGTQC